MRLMERHWYRSYLDLVSLALLPFSWMFRAIVFLRRLLYRIHVKKTYHFPVPVIVVGNITVGGTGKTPFVIWLAAFLKRQGYQPGIVSRGVGGKQQRRPRWVHAASDVSEVGDEAVLLAQKTQCPLVVGMDRVAAIHDLLAKTNCDVVISDDGLQHYRMGRDIEIAMVDGQRGVGNARLLPAGPLRENKSRLQEVDVVIVQGENIFSIQGKQEAIRMQLQDGELIAMRDEAEKKSLMHFKQGPVHAVAAIGNPQRFFDRLRQQGLTLIEHAFPDHYLYHVSDFYFSDDFPILMTEKDAVKCKKFADKRFYYLPVEAKIDPYFETFFLTLLKGRSVHEFNL